MTTEEKKCKHCGMDIDVRNPSGYCDHLYYPERCEVCSAPQETGREWEKDFDSRFDYSIIESVIRDMGDKATWLDMKKGIKAFIRSIESSALSRGEKIGAEKERERIRTKIVAYAIEGRFDADEIKGLSLYSKIIRYFDALKGKHHE